MPLDCEELDEVACQDAVSAAGNPCSWQTFQSVQREGDVCTFGDPVSLCVELSGWGTADGCGIPAGCEATGEVPFFREMPDGTVLLGSWCGGSPPTSFSACEDGLPEVTPGECACVCSLAGDSMGCDGAANLQLGDGVVDPQMAPDWNAGESARVQVTMTNPGTGFWNYPGIQVTSDHPGVTSQSPTNHLFGIEGGMSTPIGVVFDAAPDVPGGTVVTFTVTVDVLNQGCTGLDSLEVQATVLGQ